MNKLITYLSLLKRDLIGVKTLHKTKFVVNGYKKRNSTIPTIFHDLVKKQPNKLALICEDYSWTYKQLNEYSNKVANCFLELGYNKDDEIALFMESKPNFLAFWLGLSKIGVISALVNTNLKLSGIEHSLTSINCKAVVFDKCYKDVINEAIPLIKKTRNIDFYMLDDDGKVNDLPNDIKSLNQTLNSSSKHLESTYRGNFNDRLFYIFTSGTTGYPKAAIIRHARYIMLGYGLRCIVNMKNDDIIYTPMPLYHMAAGMLASSQSLLFGNTLVTRSKFSATHYWQDCVKHKCTIAQYIGELCRYLYNHPPSEYDQKHCVQKMFGNGLRINVWENFQKRFNIKQIYELYGATESNSSTANLDNKVGACGFFPFYLPNFLVKLTYPLSLIKVDETTLEPIRDRRGLCIPCKKDEPGLLIGKINIDDPVSAFDGYVNLDATDKKVIRNVYRKGDHAFVSGDILIKDKHGYLYFKDRLGDTFRWKGENISTTELEAIISMLTEHSDCVVYGVDIPNTEGKAGMACIYNQNFNINLQQLLAQLKRQLPVYSIPIFIRILNEVETTSTFKLPKTVLQKESYNPSLTKDLIYYLNMKTNHYEILDMNIYNQILNGAIKF